MSGRGERKIRFAVGAPDGAQGSVYTLRGIDGTVRPDGPSDLYLAARSLRGLFKTSLHATGQWHSAFTAEAVGAGRVQIPPGADRKVTGWERPAMVARGFTIAYSIATPSSELRTTRERDHGAGVHWIPDPGPGLVIQFYVLLFDPVLDTASAFGLGGQQDRKILDQFQLPNGEAVCVMSRKAPFDDGTVKLIRDTAGRLTVSAPDGGILDPMDRVRSTLIMEMPDGGEALIDVAIPCTV